MKSVLIAIMLMPLGFFLLLTASLAYGDVRITEIMYDPPGEDRYFEFIEICNLGVSLVNISGYYFQGISFAFPQETFIGQRECLVVASAINNTGDNNDFQDRYGLYTPYEFKGFLVNSGMRVSLLEPSLGTVVHEFTYSGEIAKGNGYSISIFNDTEFETSPNPFVYPYWDNLSQLYDNATSLEPDKPGYTEEPEHTGDAGNDADEVDGEEENKPEIPDSEQEAGNDEESKDNTKETEESPEEEAGETNPDEDSESPGDSADEADEADETDEFDDDEAVLGEEEQESSLADCLIEFYVSSLNEKNIKYKLISSMPYEYWIEDVFGNVIKAPLVSSTASVKSFTTTAYPRFVIVYRAQAEPCTEQYQFVRLSGLEKEIVNSSCSLSIDSSGKATLSSEFFIKPKSGSIECKLNKKTVFKEELSLEYSGFKYTNQLSFGLPMSFAEGELVCEYRFSPEKFSCSAFASGSDVGASSDQEKEIKPSAASLKGISSFYTLQKYFLGSNRFFVNLAGSLDDGENPEEAPTLQVFGKLLEIKVTDSARLSFNLSGIAPQGTLLALLSHKGSVVEQKTLEYCFELRDSDLLLGESQLQVQEEDSGAGLITGSIAAGQAGQSSPPKLDIVLKSKDEDKTSALFSDSAFLLIFSAVIAASLVGLFFVSRKVLPGLRNIELSLK
ncbi:MAG TPA: lamin tail domain-containing protein [Candidatus Woesearchaeota archaeon]|nr:lamin tail domain-containing protein [Candidatus Woesearchaeota archaeon]